MLAAQPINPANPVVEAETASPRVLQLAARTDNDSFYQEVTCNLRKVVGLLDEELRFTNKRQNDLHLNANQKKTNQIKHTNETPKEQTSG